MGKSWVLDVQHNDETDETFIQLPDELMKEAGWNLGGICFI